MAAVCCGHHVEAARTAARWLALETGRGRGNRCGRTALRSCRCVGCGWPYRAVAGSCAARARELGAGDADDARREAAAGSVACARVSAWAVPGRAHDRTCGRGRRAHGLGARRKDENRAPRTLSELHPRNRTELRVEPRRSTAGGGGEPGEGRDDAA